MLYSSFQEEGVTQGKYQCFHKIVILNVIFFNSRVFLPAINKYFEKQP